MSIMNSLDWQQPANDNNSACMQCGIDINGPKTKLYCGKACSSKAKRIRDKTLGKAHNDGAPDHICEECGAVFQRRKDSHNAARFCSRSCGFAAQSNLNAKQRHAETIKSFKVSYTVKRSICLECGLRFQADILSQSICSDGCRDARTKFQSQQAQASKSDIDRSERVCPECAIIFAPVYGRAHSRFCTDACSQKNLRRKGSAKRRARMKGVANDNFDPIEILSRDGWKCQMCGVKTPKRLRGTTDPRAPELDHIIPISLGGDHTRINTQCACRRCNGNKGASLLGQLRLFG